MKIVNDLRHKNQWIEAPIQIVLANDTQQQCSEHFSPFVSFEERGKDFRFQSRDIWHEFITMCIVCCVLCVCDKSEIKIVPNEFESEHISHLSSFRFIFHNSLWPTDINEFIRLILCVNHLNFFPLLSDVFISCFLSLPLIVSMGNMIQYSLKLESLASFRFYRLVYLKIYFDR